MHFFLDVFPKGSFCLFLIGQEIGIKLEDLGSSYIGLHLCLIPSLAGFFKNSFGCHYERMSIVLLVLLPALGVCILCCIIVELEGLDGVNLLLEVASRPIYLMTRVWDNQMATLNLLPVFGTIALKYVVLVLVSSASWIGSCSGL